MAKYTLKYIFDWGSSVCLWSADQETEDYFKDYPIDHTKLPISDELKKELDHLILWHDEALDWSNPGGALLWDEKQIGIFIEAAEKCYYRLCEELGSDFDVELSKQHLI
jgi:hypothetical protein